MFQVEKNPINHMSDISTIHTVEAQLCRFALGLKYEDLNAASIDAAKVFISDTISVGVAGYNAPLAHELRSCVAAWGHSEIGASVLGSDARYPLANAAYLNAFQIHCQEFDCVHEAAVVHPMASVFAAIFSQAGVMETVTGQDVLMATVVGVEIATRLGVCVSSPLKFFRPATAGVFGATLAVARLRGLSETQALEALGVALAQCSGTMQAHIEGKPTLALQVANAARGAIMACDLIEAGFSGPSNALCGPFGYLTLFEDEFDVDALVDGLGGVGSWERFNIIDLSHKPYPTGRAAHGGLDCLKLAMEQGLNADNMSGLTLKAPPIIYRLVGRAFKANASVNYARLCYAYLASRMLLDGDVGLASFSKDKLRDPRLEALASLVKVVDDGTADPASFAPQRLFVQLKDGTDFETSIRTQPASPERPFTKDEQLEKFINCLNFGAPQASRQKIENLSNQLSKLEDVASFKAVIMQIRDL